MRVKSQLITIWSFRNLQQIETVFPEKLFIYGLAYLLSVTESNSPD